MRINAATHDFLTAQTGVLAPATLVWYEEKLTHLVDFLSDAEVESVTIRDLREWRAALLAQPLRWEHHPTRPTKNSGLSPHTVAGHVRAARRLFSWLVEEGYLDANPAQRLRPPALPDRGPKAISLEDVQKMIDAAEDPRDRALVLFLADTGARVSGVAGLGIRDLDLGNGRAVVAEKAIGRGGNGRQRAVYFTDTTAEALRAYLDGRDDDHAAVFVGRLGPLTTAGIYKALRRIAQRAGVKRFNPHAFRHFRARAALEAGADLATTSQILGHRGVSITADFYARFGSAELGERARRFSPFAEAE